MRRLSKRALVFVGVCFLVVSLLIIGKIAKSLFIDESDDDNVLSHITTTARQLQGYYSQNGRFPEKLEQINSGGKFCSRWNCYEIKYKASQDKQNFTLVSAVNYPFIAYSYTEGCGFTKEWLGCSGYAVAEGYSDFPVYKRDRELFATPSS